MAISVNERLDMLQKASKAWLELSKLLKTIPDARLETPNTVGVWSGKDVLAHMGNWNEDALCASHRYAQGEDFEWPSVENDDFDGWNAEHVAPWREKSLAEVRQYLEQTHFALLDFAEKESEVRPRVIVGATDGHYREHFDDLRALAGRNDTR